MQKDEFQFTIKTGNIETVVQLSQQILEFKNPHGAAEYHKRLSDVPHLILIAYDQDQAVGFKVGYERDGYFYSWMGGVLSNYRRFKIASALAKHQESWALSRGYTSITFKTRNSHKAMLIFALKNGFNIIDLEKRALIGEYRILLKKELSS